MLGADVAQHDVCAGRIEVVEDVGDLQPVGRPENTVEGDRRLIEPVHVDHRPALARRGRHRQGRESEREIGADRHPHLRGGGEVTDPSVRVDDLLRVDHHTSCGGCTRHPSHEAALVEGSRVAGHRGDPTEEVHLVGGGAHQQVDVRPRPVAVHLEWGHRKARRLDGRSEREGQIAGADRRVRNLDRRDEGLDGKGLEDSESTPVDAEVVEHDSRIAFTALGILDMARGT